jgi:hypothetical protein
VTQYWACYFQQRINVDAICNGNTLHATMVIPQVMNITISSLMTDLWHGGGAEMPERVEQARSSTVFTSGPGHLLGKG